MVRERLDKAEGFFFVYISSLAGIEPIYNTFCVFREQRCNLIYFQYNTASSILRRSLYSDNKVSAVFLQLRKNHSAVILTVSIIKHSNRRRYGFGQVFNI